MFFNDLISLQIVQLKQIMIKIIDVEWGAKQRKSQELVLNVFKMNDHLSKHWSLITELGITAQFQRRECFCYSSKVWLNKIFSMINLFKKSSVIYFVLLSIS